MVIFRESTRIADYPIPVKRAFRQREWDFQRQQNGTTGKLGYQWSLREGSYLRHLIAPYLFDVSLIDVFFD